MSLFEIEPGQFIAPDLVTDVFGDVDPGLRYQLATNTMGWDWMVTIQMVGGGKVTLTGPGAHDSQTTRSLGQEKAREFAARIDLHRLVR